MGPFPSSPPPSLPLLAASPFLHHASGAQLPAYSMPPALPSHPAKQLVALSNRNYARASHEGRSPLLHADVPFLPPFLPSCLLCFLLLDCLAFILEIALAIAIAGAPASLTRPWACQCSPRVRRGARAAALVRPVPWDRDECTLYVMHPRSAPSQVCFTFMASCSLR